LGITKEYTGQKDDQPELIEAVSSLSPEEQASVLEFIEDLKGQKSYQPSPFVQAADRFIAQHPELLRRLAE
jgi:hypothetical protein